MITIKIYPPHKTTINKSLFKSDKMTKTWYIMQRNLIIDDQDIDETIKILDKLETPWSIIS